MEVNKKTMDSAEQTMHRQSRRGQGYYRDSWIRASQAYRLLRQPLRYSTSL